MASFKRIRTEMSFLKRRSTMVESVHRANDFLLTEDEKELPHRRDGINAAAVLKHLTQLDIEALAEAWGDQTVTLEEFIELMQPYVGQSEFFYRDGSKNESRWLKDGWISESQRKLGAKGVHRPSFGNIVPFGSFVFANSGEKGRRKTVTFDGGVLSPKRRDSRRKSSFSLSAENPFEEDEPTPLTDLQEYLQHIFIGIDTERRNCLRWEQFLTFLVDGIGGDQQHQQEEFDDFDDEPQADEQYVKYNFMGEQTVFQRKVDFRTSRDWYSKLRYIPRIDRCMCVSKHRIGYATPGADFDNELMQHSLVLQKEPITTAEYIPEFDVTVTAAFEKKPLRIYQHHGTHEPRVVVHDNPGFAEETYVSAMSWLKGKLMIGTRTGTVCESSVSYASGEFTIGRMNPLHQHKSVVTTFFHHQKTGNIITGSLDKTAHIMDCTGSGRNIDLHHNHGVTAIGTSDYTSVLLTAGFDDYVSVWAENLWDMPIFKLTDTMRPFCGNVVGIQQLPMTPYVAIGDSSGTLRFYDLRKKDIVLFCKNVGDAEHVTEGLVRREHLRTDNSNGEDEEKGQEVRTKTSALFQSMEFTGSSTRQFWFGGSRIYHFVTTIESRENPYLAYDKGDRVLGVGMNSAAGIFSVSTKEVTLWSNSTGLPDTRRKNLMKKITACAVRDGCDIVVLGSEEGKVASFQLSKGVQLQQYRNHNHSISFLDFHPTLPCLVSISNTEKRMTMWECELFGTEAKPSFQPLQSKAVPMQTLNLNSICNSVDFHHGGDVLILCLQVQVLVYVKHQEYNRWVPVARLRHGETSELLAVRFLSSPWKPEMDAEGDEDSPYSKHALIVSDSKGLIVMWALAVDVDNLQCEQSLLCVWYNKGVDYLRHSARTSRIYQMRCNLDANATARSSREERSNKAALREREHRDQTELRKKRHQEELQLLEAGDGLSPISPRSGLGSGLASPRYRVNARAGLGIAEAFSDIDPQLAHALADEAYSYTTAPPLRCMAFDSAHPSLLFTGDDLGRVNVWHIQQLDDVTCPSLDEILENASYLGLCDPKEQRRSTTWSSTSFSAANGRARRKTTEASHFPPPPGFGRPPEILTSFVPHQQSVVSIAVVTRPNHVVLTAAMDNSVSLSSWYGEPIAMLQQGPLAERVWSMQRELHRMSSNFRARLRWLLLRRYVVGGLFRVMAAKELAPQKFASMQLSMSNVEQLATSFSLKSSIGGSISVPLGRADSRTDSQSIRLESSSSLPSGSVQDSDEEDDDDDSATNTIFTRRAEKLRVRLPQAMLTPARAASCEPMIAPKLRLGRGQNDRVQRDKAQQCGVDVVVNQSNAKKETKLKQKLEDVFGKKWDDSPQTFEDRVASDSDDDALDKFITAHFNANSNAHKSVAARPALKREPELPPEPIAKRRIAPPALPQKILTQDGLRHGSSLPTSVTPQPANHTPVLYTTASAQRARSREDTAYRYQARTAGTWTVEQKPQQHRAPTVNSTHAERHEREFENTFTQPALQHERSHPNLSKGVPRFAPAAKHPHAM